MTFELVSVVFQDSRGHASVEDLRPTRQCLRLGVWPLLMSVFNRFELLVAVNVFVKDRAAVPRKVHQ
jgi:hypothetical protein